MQNYILEGVGTIQGGEYDSISIEGVANCSNSIKANSIHIEGVFNCAGAIEAVDLHCEGVADFKSNIRAKRMTVEGVLSMKGDSKIEAEEIICEGVIKTNGEISTDIMSAEGCIVAKEIVGDQIRIDSHYKINRFIRFFNRFKSEVKLIEATTIELSGVTAESVNGRDIIIGPNCKINNIDCSGVLSIDRTSEVGAITGEYTIRN